MNRLESALFVICSVGLLVWTHHALAACQNNSCTPWTTPCPNGTSVQGNPCSSKGPNWVTTACSNEGEPRGPSFACCCTLPEYYFDEDTLTFVSACCQLTCRAYDCTYKCQDLSVVVGAPGSTVYGGVCGGGQGAIHRWGSQGFMGIAEGETAPMDYECLGGICKRRTSPPE